MVRTLVSHLVDTLETPPEIARGNIDADYIKGFLLFRPTAVLTVDADTQIETKGTRPPGIRIVERNGEAGAYLALDVGRKMSEFKEFQLDDMIREAKREVKAWGTKR